MTTDLATQDDVIDAPIVSNDTLAEPVDIKDSMLSTLKSIRERDNESKPDRVRAPDGKFAKSDGETIPDASKPAGLNPAVAASPQGTEGISAAPDAQANPSAITPPASLKGSVKAKFASLDPEVQQEFIRREADFHKGIEQHKQAAKQFEDAARYASAMHRAISPYQQIIQQQGVPADQAIGMLLRTDATLRYGTPEQKLTLFHKMAGEYGIDMSQGLPDIPQVDPTVQHMQQQLQMTQQRLVQLAQQQQQREQQMQQAQIEHENQELASIIEKSKQGKEHFDDVRPEMAALLQAGRVTSIDEAYDQAVWARPDLRQKFLAKQQEEYRAEQAKKAQAAKQAAAVNVQSRGTMPAQQPTGDRQEIMKAVLENIRSR